MFELLYAGENCLLAVWMWFNNSLAVITTPTQKCSGRDVQVSAGLLDCQVVDISELFQLELECVSCIFCASIRFLRRAICVHVLLVSADFYSAMNTDFRRFESMLLFIFQRTSEQFCLTSLNAACQSSILKLFAWFLLCGDS